ncbi:MAG: hypothetical protein HY262_05460 [Chloroflexi bacterium]|nr:hypothetical protein [Chloroflexota bacterium]
MQHAIELRRSLGLRSDLAWVEAVAADPRATSTLLAIPLLPDEAAAVNAQSNDAEAVIAVVNDYVASHVDEFGGVYIDHASGAGVVALWTAHLEEHETAIRARLKPGARFAVRLVAYTERYLRGLQDRVVADRDWMASIPAVFESAGVDVIRNVTMVSVSSANPNAPDLVEAHYGFGNALEVDSDGTGAVLIPWGKVEGRVRTPAGDPPADNWYNLAWHSSGPGACGIGDVGYGLTADGTFSLPCQQGTWTIEVTVPGDGGWRSIGEGTVVVKADRTSRLDIVPTEP